MSEMVSVCCGAPEDPDIESFCSACHEGTGFEPAVEFNLERLHKILAVTCTQLRKGPEVTSEQSGGGMEVITVQAMPHESAFAGREGYAQIDVHFLTISVDLTEAEEHKAELIEILGAYPEPERLAAGPSYIEIGGVIGDQGAALTLFALGEALDLWRVLTPATLGIEGSDAKDLAGRGMVLMSGFDAHDWEEKTASRRIFGEEQTSSG